MIETRRVFSNPIPILWNMMRLLKAYNEISAGINEILNAQNGVLSQPGSAGRRIRYY
jgi:hypothetical protein